MRHELKTLISPNFPAEKLDAPTVDDLIDVFEDRIRYWLIEPAKTLIADPVARVAGFGLLLSYFEGIWIYMQGRDSKGQSRKFFVLAFVDVFRSSNISTTLLARVAGVLYEDARCGFFHDAMFRTRIYFSEIYTGPIAIILPKHDGAIDESGEIQTIVIHPPEFFRYVDGHFGKLVACLRDPTESKRRDRFVQACKLKWDLGGPPRIIAF